MLLSWWPTVRSHVVSLPVLVVDDHIVELLHDLDELGRVRGHLLDGRSPALLLDLLLGGRVVRFVFTFSRLLSTSTSFFYFIQISVLNSLSG